MSISYEDFSKVDIRLGRIIDVQDFPEARKPAYKLAVDFGPEVGVKTSSAQITKHYTKALLIGRHVMGVVNVPPKQIGPFVSEARTLGIADANGDVVLLGVDHDAPLGARMY